MRKKQSRVALNQSKSPSSCPIALNEYAFPVQARALRGYICRERAWLERVPGWRALPNGIVVRSNPQATHFHEPRTSIGDEWSARMTLAKTKDGSGAWEQTENVVELSTIITKDKHRYLIILCLQVRELR